MAPETRDISGQPPEAPESRNILRRSAEFKRALDFPIDVSDEQWKKDLEKALSRPPEPTAENLKNPTAVRMQYAQKERSELLAHQESTDILFDELTSEAGGGVLPEMYAAIALTRVADLLNRRRMYDSFMKEEKPESPSMLPLYLSIAASEVAEETVISLLPELPSAEVKGKISRLRGVISAEKRLAATLQKAGIKNADVARMLAKMPRETTQMVGKLVARATPNSVYDILLMSYYLHESDDKMAAAMQFSTFLVAQGLSEVVIESVASRFAILGKLPKNPYVVTAVALALVIGLDKTLGFDKITAWAESQVDPANWDMGGQIVDTVSGSKLFDDAGELGYMTGLRTVDPLSEMKSFLMQKLQMNRGDGAKVEYAHGMLDWNEQVERMAIAAEEEGNPVKAALYRLEKIGHGEWADRQAVLFYGNVQRLKGMQTALNEQTGSNLDIIDAVTASRNDDAEFRRLLQTPLLTSDVQSKIDAIQDPEKKKDAQDNYDSYIYLARQIATDVTLYVHLGVYDPRWLQTRDALGESSIIPAAVEKGMIAHLKYRSERRKALDPASYPQLDGKKFAENLSSLYKRDRDPDPWPDISQHPIDWFHRFRKHNGDYNSRVIGDVEEFVELPNFLKDVAAITGKNPALAAALDPLMKIIEEKKNTVSPEEIQKAVLTALAEALPDSDIRFYNSFTSFKGSDILRSVTRGRMDSSALQKHMEDFSKEGPSANFYSSQNMSFNIDYNMEWDESSRQWMVRVSPKMLNPSNRGFVYLGVKIVPGTLKAPERLIPFSAWAQKHPQAAKSVLPQLADHQKWMAYLKTRVAEAKRLENLYPIAGKAVEAPGTWFADNERQDEFKGRIEYVSWPDPVQKTLTIYSQTTDGLDCRIHHPDTNAGVPLPGKYFDGIERVLKDIPADRQAYAYDSRLRSWIPRKFEADISRWQTLDADAMKAELDANPGIDGELAVLRTSIYKKREEEIRNDKELQRQKVERQKPIREEYQRQVDVRNAAIEDAKSKPNRFVRIPGVAGPAELPELKGIFDELRCYVSDGSYLTRKIGSASSVSRQANTVSGLQSPVYSDEGRAFTFDWHANDGKTVFHSLTGNGFVSQQNLGEHTKQLMMTAVCAPIEGSDEESIDKVLNAFNHEIYIPGSVASVFADRHYYKAELAKQLLPLYVQSGDKTAFLRRLFDQLNANNGITEDSVATVLKAMQ